MKGGRKSQSSYHHGNLRRALVTAARRLVEEEGPEALSLRSVARQAGVSQAAPYHHFEGKDGLLAAVAAEGYRELTAFMLGQVQENQDAFGQFQGLGVGYVLFAVAHPALFRLMQGPRPGEGESFAELHRASSKSYDLLRGAVDSCLPGASEGQRAHACAAAWSLVHGMATLCVDGRLGMVLDTEDLADAARRVTAQLDISRVLEGPETD